VKFQSSLLAFSKINEDNENHVCETILQLVDEQMFLDNMLENDRVSCRGNLVSSECFRRLPNRETFVETPSFRSFSETIFRSFLMP
jgi:hypothetical protein